MSADNGVNFNPPSSPRSTWNPDNCIICDTPLNPLTGAPNCLCFSTAVDTLSTAVPGSSSGPSSSSNSNSNSNSNSFTPDVPNPGLNINTSSLLLHNAQDDNDLIQTLSYLADPSDEPLQTPPIGTYEAHFQNHAHHPQRPHINTPVINISTMSFSDHTPQPNLNVAFGNICSVPLDHSSSACSVSSSNNSLSPNDSHDDLLLSVDPSTLSVRHNSSSYSNSNFHLPVSPSTLAYAGSTGSAHRYRRTFSGSSFSSEFSSSHSLDSLHSGIDSKDKASIVKPGSSAKTSSNVLSPTSPLFARLARDSSSRTRARSQDSPEPDAVDRTDRLTVTSKSSSRSSSVSRTSRSSKSRSKTRSSSKPSAARKDVVCDFCGKTFNNNSKLKSHTLTHTNEKTYTCDAVGCNKAFARRSDLRRHQRTIHSNIDDAGSRRQKCGGWSKGILLLRTKTSDPQALPPAAAAAANENDQEWFEPSVVEGEGTKWGCGDEFLRMDGLVKHWRESRLGKECLDSLMRLFGDLALHWDDETKLNIAKENVRSLK